MTTDIESAKACDARHCAVADAANCKSGACWWQIGRPEPSGPRANIVPGAMRCAKCNFQLMRVNLYVQSGNVGAGDNEPERCPNGCGPLWPVTWDEEAREAMKMVEQQYERADKAEKVLRELVALKELKEHCLRVRQRRPQSVTRIWPQDLLDAEAEADYNRRKPLAWEAAIAITGPIF